MEAEKPTTPKLARTLRSRLLSNAMKVLRLGAFFAFLGVISLVLLARMAYGRAKDLALKTGEDLVRLTEVTPGEYYSLRLNGELMQVTSASTGASVTEVLDHFLGECALHADGISEEFSHLKAAVQPGAAPKNVGFPGVGVMKKATPESGVVVCFAQGRAVSEAEAYKNVAEFARTGDVAKIGKLRYVVAKKGQTGTHVVAVWTEGSFDLNRMFPDVGDAPGSDPSATPRPEGSRRIFTAFAENAPYAIRVYETTKTADAVLASYDALLPKSGWVAHADASRDVKTVRAYSKGGVDTIITVEKNDASTSVAIVEVGAK